MDKRQLEEKACLVVVATVAESIIKSHWVDLQEKLCLTPGRSEDSDSTEMQLVIRKHWPSQVGSMTEIYGGLQMSSDVEENQ